MMEAGAGSGAAGAAGVGAGRTVRFGHPRRPRKPPGLGLSPWPLCRGSLLKHALLERGGWPLPRPAGAPGAKRRGAQGGPRPGAPSAPHRTPG